MIRYHGYPVEVHNVTTTDGYILELHRIPNSFISNSTQRKRPVLLVHGYADTSATWVMIGPNRSIGALTQSIQFKSFLMEYVRIFDTSLFVGRSRA